jgi:DtxR family Mn-dependent transcriptional regulator
MRSTVHTAAEEDYLKAVLLMQEEEEPATTSSLASRLHVKPASVTGMLQRLGARRLVRYRPYRAVTLTRKGRATALATLRRHRLIELYLVEVLGLSWDRVHAVAERWEHVVCVEVIDRIDSALRNPTHDPHGAPIPTPEGSLEKLDGQSVADLRPGQSARVSEIPDREPDLVRHLEKLGLVPDAHVEVLEVAPFDRTVTLRIGRRRQTIGHAVGSRIRVADVDPRT